MSFLDPYTAGDVNPDELNPRFVHYCVAGIVACVAAWLLLDDLMLRLVLAGGIIGLVTAIAGRGVQQIEVDGPVAVDRNRPTAAGPDHQRGPVRLRDQPLVAMPAGTSWEGRWAAARSRHDKLLRDWLPFETDPEKVLSYPTLSDVREEPTARFFDAMHDADVLRTDDFAGAATTAEYIDAVRVLAQSWEGARRHALRTGMDGLDQSDRRTLQQAIKLLRHADAAKTSSERALYATRAQQLLAPLVDNGTVRLPELMTAAIATARRGAIAAPENT
jgi:hypothetical protein